MNLATFKHLLTTEGQAAITAAQALNPSEDTFLTNLTNLQKNFDSDLAKAALETVILRRKAQGKFARADQMYFEREALEQASGERIARYRAARFVSYASVLDVCCGLGGDAIGLASVATVTVVDKDPLRFALAQANLAAYGLRAQHIEADVTQIKLPPAEALWFDPARRIAGRRTFSVEAYQPPLNLVRKWNFASALGVKLSPGVNLDELREYGGELEFISEQGELKECVLWLGAAQTTTRRATLLTGAGPVTLTAEAADAPPSTNHTPQRYLYEPDPAILRAGLVTHLAAQLNAHQLDPDIAYLTADSLITTPLARAFTIDDAFPFQLKRLREYLRARQVGVVTVKKRGSPLEPEQLIRQLKLSGPESRIVFLTHVAGKAYVLVGQAA